MDTIKLRPQQAKGHRVVVNIKVRTRIRLVDNRDECVLSWNLDSVNTDLLRGYEYDLWFMTHEDMVRKSIQDVLETRCPNKIKHVVTETVILRSPGNRIEKIYKVE